MRTLVQASGTRGEIWISAQVRRNRGEKCRIDSQRQVWPVSFFRSSTDRIWRKSSHRKLSVKFSSVAQRCRTYSKYREIGARDESAFRYRETGAWSTEATCKGQVEPPQSRDLQYSIHWERLRDCSTKVESSRRRPDSQRKDMEITHVNNKNTIWNTNFEAPKTLFDITQSLILNQKHETQHLSTIE